MFLLWMFWRRLYLIRYLHPLTKTLNDILALESVSFPPPPPLVKSPEKQNLNKFCNYHGDMGHNTNDYYHLKRQIEEAVAASSPGERDSSRKPKKWESGKRACQIHKHGFSGKVYYSLSLIDLEVTMGEPGRSKTVLLEFSIVKCRSPYNVIIGRIGMRSLGAVVTTIVPRFVMEHQLKAYPLAEPIAHRKRPLTPDQRQVLKERVFNWLKEGIIRRVQYLGWVTNAVLIKQRSGSWKVQMDYTSLNKVCEKDMYPLLEVDETLASLGGHQYKCFMRLPKEYNQIQIREDNKEKTRFHTEEGIYCLTHMLKELKNSAITLKG
ncbi:hypothetical protein Tco_1037066 [Tanacetum coccineum]